MNSKHLPKILLSLLFCTLLACSSNEETSTEEIMTVQLKFPNPATLTGKGIDSLLRYEAKILSTKPLKILSKQLEVISASDNSGEGVVPIGTVGTIQTTGTPGYWFNSTTNCFEYGYWSTLADGRWKFTYASPQTQYVMNICAGEGGAYAIDNEITIGKQ